MYFKRSSNIIHLQSERKCSCYLSFNFPQKTFFILESIFLLHTIADRENHSVNAYSVARDINGNPQKNTVRYGSPIAAPGEFIFTLPNPLLSRFYEFIAETADPDYTIDNDPWRPFRALFAHVTPDRPSSQSRCCFRVIANQKLDDRAALRCPAKPFSNAGLERALKTETPPTRSGVSGAAMLGLRPVRGVTSQSI
ncbi:hypothetical protein GWI33_002516 [Rhynchophorus ferrugineus]|uniref:Uncharacterized protein n=1 Tax=Rhynchophorus ferrugineus TaxID=354439 RepID=A0A834MKC0_RHYFE|nr:hypothetical protein GWI33_002516 [Rhynchophorus ferrugineus]